MKHTANQALVLLTCLFLNLFASAQIDSVKTLLGETEDAEKRIGLLLMLSKMESPVSMERAVAYAEKGEAIATEIRSHQNRLRCMLRRGNVYYQWQQLPQAKHTYASSLEFADSIGDERGMAAALTNLGAIAHVEGEPETAEKHYKRAIGLYGKLDLQGRKANTMTSLGVLLLETGQYAKAQEMERGAAAVFRAAGDTSKYTKALQRQGMVFSYTSELDSALWYFFKAKELSEEIGSLEGIGASWNNIAHVYLENGVPERALEYLEKSREVHHQMGDVKGEAVPVNNMGMVYLQWGDIEKAEKHFKEGLAMRESIGHDLGRTESLISLGHLYLKKQSSDTAKQYFDQALPLAEHLQDQQKLSQIHLGLGACALDAGQLTAATVALEKGLALADTTGNLPEVKDGEGWLALAYKQKGQFKLAMVHFERHVRLKDELYNAEKLAELVDMENRFLNEKTRREKLELELDVQERDVELASKNRNLFVVWMTFLGLVVLGLLGGVLFYLASRNRRLRLEARLREMHQSALSAQMNPHFVFNAMNCIQRFILKNDQDAAYKYLEKFASLIRTVFHHSGRKSISIADELEWLSLYIELENLRFEEKFQLDMSVGADIDAQSVKISPMILQPFVENAIQHGLIQKASSGKLSIRIASHKEKIHCCIEDNGVGRAATAEKGNFSNHNSQGIEKTRDRIRLVNGRSSGRDDLTITDLVDASGAAAGTRVEINIIKMY